GGTLVELAGGRSAAAGALDLPTVVTPDHRHAGLPRALADLVVGALGQEHGGQVLVAGERRLGGPEQAVGGGQLVGGLAGVGVGQDVGGDPVGVAGECRRHVAVHVVA